MTKIICGVDVSKARLDAASVLDFVSCELIVETSRTKHSADVVALLERLDCIYGPKPGQGCKPATIVLDNGPVHRSKATLAALAAREHWLRSEWRTRPENPQGPSSPAQNLQGRRQPQDCHRRRDQSHELKPKIPSVGQPAETRFRLA